MNKHIISRKNAEIMDSLQVESRRFIAEEGEAVEILETWHKVRVGGRVGYVPAEVIRPRDTEISEISHLTPASPLEPSVSDISAINIQVYRGSSFTSERPIECDLAFHQALTRIDNYAANAGVFVYVTQSLRHKDRQPVGAVVPPAKRSNHLVGHAIDMNLYVGNRSNWFNSRKLKRKNLPSLPSAVRNFIEMIRGDDILRWGGDFIREDPVHIDDNLYGRAPDIWMKKFEAT